MFKPEHPDTEYDRGKYMLTTLGLTVRDDYWWGHSSCFALSVCRGQMQSFSILATCVLFLTSTSACRACMQSVGGSSLADWLLFLLAWLLCMLAEVP